MAFSKGKRIEDETSQRIIDLAVHIGCKEGTDALTVTRICRELSCDRRVIYNRFRDVDEINMIVAGKCNEELLSKAREQLRDGAPFLENLTTLVRECFTYIYEKNAYFQYYTALYEVTEEGIENEILQYLTDYIDSAKKAKEVSAQTDSHEAAECIWQLLVGISGMLATHVNYKYQAACNTLLYGVEAICNQMKK